MIPLYRFVKRRVDVNVLAEFAVRGRLAQSGRPIMTSFWRGERFWARKRVESYGRCLEPAKVAAKRAVGEALGYVTQRWGGARCRWHRCDEPVSLVTCAGREPKKSSWFVG